MAVELLSESGTVERPPTRGQQPPSRVGRNIAAMAGGQMLTWAMTFAWTLVVPRILGPAAIGLIVSAWSVTGILAIVLGFGTKNYLVRAIVVDRSAAPILLASASVLRLLLSPAFCLGLIVYAHFAHYGHDGTVVLYLAGGAMLLTLLAEPMQAAFQAIERMEYLAYSDVINKSVQGLLGIVLAVAGFGAVGFAACWMAMSGVVVLLNVIWLKGHVRLQLRTTVRRVARMAKDSVAYWAFGMFFMIYLWIDTAMLSLMTNSTVVGWYGVPTKLFQTMMFIPVLVSTAWLPRLVGVFERDPAELPMAARVPVELMLILGVPIAAGIAMTAAPVIHLVYGPAYGHAVPVMILLGLCIPPMYLNIMLSQVLVAAERQVVWTWAMAGATVLNPAVNAVLIPLTQRHFGNGAIGAAISLLITELAVVAIGLTLVGRSVIGRPQLRRFSLAVVASGGMWLIADLSRPLGPALSIGAGCLTFVVLATVLRLVTPAEKEFVVQRLVGVLEKMPAPTGRLSARLGAHGGVSGCSPPASAEPGRSL